MRVYIQFSPLLKNKNWFCNKYTSLSCVSRNAPSLSARGSGTEIYTIGHRRDDRANYARIAIHIHIRTCIYSKPVFHFDPFSLYRCNFARDRNKTNCVRPEYVSKHRRARERKFIFSRTQSSDERLGERATQWSRIYTHIPNWQANAWALYVIYEATRRCSTNHPIRVLYTQIYMLVLRTSSSLLIPINLFTRTLRTYIIWPK